MADLDDFFAKKDKKKKGKNVSKSAKANTNILAQNLIENDKKKEDNERKAAIMSATSEANRVGAAKKDISSLEFDNSTINKPGGSEEKANKEKLNENMDRIQLSKINKRKRLIICRLQQKSERYFGDIKLNILISITGLLLTYRQLLYLLLGIEQDKMKHVKKNVRLKNRLKKKQNKN